MEQVTLEINGKSVQAPKGSTILQAATLSGIKIPTLCLWPAWQQYAGEYGVTKSRFRPAMTDCSLCGLCVRYCAEVKKDNALYFKGRGIDRKPELIDGSHDQCGQCRECFALCSGGWVVASRS